MIRAYQNSDSNALIEILTQLVPEYFDPGEINDYQQYLNSEIEHYFVYENHGQIIGAAGINLFNDKKQIRLSWDFVHPDFKGTGIGTKLLEYRLNWINENARDFDIIVRTSQMSHGFYNKRGFILKEIVPDYWAKGYDLYLMYYNKP